MISIRRRLLAMILGALALIFAVIASMNFFFTSDTVSGMIFYRFQYVGL